MPKIRYDKHINILSKYLYFFSELIETGIWLLLEFLTGYKCYNKEGEK